MTRFTCSLWSSVLLSAFAIAATETPSEAGTKVKVTFSGSGFSGWFLYDQSQTNSPPPPPGVFKFTTVAHELHYQIGVGSWVDGSGAGCVPYTITTSGNSFHTFKLAATLPPGTTATIVLPTTIALPQTRLPFCMEGGLPVFPSPPLAGSTFTLSGGTTFSGNITSVTCAQFLLAEPAPVYPEPAYPVYTSSPTTCPVYVCQPRRACCLTRLFARRGHRSRCW